MKSLFYALLLLTFIGCKKEEMEVVPEYSFVRLNEEGAEISPCYTQIAECLPVDEISDLQFQLITDYPASQFSTTRNRLIAVPCDICGELTDQEAYEYAFGKEMIAINGSSDNGGLLELSLVTAFADLSTGDYVALTNACTVDDFNYAGTYEVVGIVGDTIVLDTPFEGFINNDCNGGSDIFVINYVKSAHLLASSSIELEDDSEFTGDNYAWNLAEPFPTNPLPYTALQCFRLCVYKVVAQINLPNELPTFVSATCIGTTNCFQKTATICYTTKLVYGCDENAFGFYTDGTNPFEMSIRLPMWLFHPRYPSEENGYQLSTGQFVKLSERIDKTWELETDWMPEQYHERLRIALGCDNIEVSNENAQLTDVAIYRKDEYSIEWSDEVKNYPFAKATTTVFKQLLTRSTNSNCV